VSEGKREKERGKRSTVLERKGERWGGGERERESEQTLGKGKSDYAQIVHLQEKIRLDLGKRWTEYFSPKDMT
jgi:hypothetical protein